MLFVRHGRVRSEIMTFDGEHFYLRGKQMGVQATFKRGRWYYRNEATNRLYASGMSPAQFAKEFWQQDLSPAGVLT